ncbi:hypothetical protein QFZ97_005404 [Paraburkholderia youngii]
MVLTIGNSKAVGHCGLIAPITPRLAENRRVAVELMHDRRRVPEALSPG